MISLRRAMDAQLQDVLTSTLSSYSATLETVSEAGAKAFPPAGEDLRSSLSVLRQRLQAEATVGLVTETEHSLEVALNAWADRAAQYHEEKTNEIKQLVMLLADAAGRVGERDQRYTKQFQHVTGQLQSAAKLNDLAAMRESLGRSVSELRICVKNMEKDGQDAIAQLRAQIAGYEARLEEVEYLAGIDQLTGVANRRKIDSQLSLRAAKGLPFSVVYMDLNGFKQINDAFGHLAGDDLLKQFAAELKSVFRQTDLVGRWGGDEFVIVIDGTLRDVQASTSRIMEWVNGEYEISTTSGIRKVNLRAAVGVATWERGQTVSQVLQRADEAMYLQKAQ